jgi:hypothetical protein
MSASTLPPIQEECDFYIREVTGGWILQFAAGLVRCSCDDPDCKGVSIIYDQRIFTSEDELGKFVVEQMTQFKLWRSRARAEDTNFKPFETAHEPFPKPGKRGAR